MRDEGGNKSRAVPCFSFLPHPSSLIPHPSSLIPFKGETVTAPSRIQVVDSHTGGEPTRIVISGGPDLGRGTLAERRALLAERHDWFRSAVVNEPRGSDI